MSRTRNEKSQGKALRYAVVGLGNISRTAVLPAFANADNARLVALVSGSKDKRQELAESFEVPVTASYDEFDALCQSGDIDAVYLGLPNHLHCDYTVRAAAAGIHVLCEKPMAVTEAECETMVRAAREHDVRLMIAYRLHFEQANLEAIERVTSGQIGEPRLFEAVFTQSVEEGDIRLGPIEKGGGTLYDLGVYCINAARYLFRQEPYEVTAVSVKRQGDERFADCDEMTTATLRFPDDRLAVFTTSFGASRNNHYSVVGTRGTLLMDPAFDYETHLTYELRQGQRSERKQLEPRDQFGPQLAYFADCVLHGREPEPGGAEGLADVRIVQALYRAASTGKPVSIAAVADQRRPSLEQAMTRPSVDGG